MEYVACHLFGKCGVCGKSTASALWTKTFSMVGQDVHEHLFAPYDCSIYGDMPHGGFYVIVMDSSGYYVCCYFCIDCRAGLWLYSVCGRPN